MHWQKFLTETITPSPKFSPRTIFWFSLSLTFAVIYSSLALQKAFSGEYVIQDDARQHVFWLQRFRDRDLFPHDLIADYFQSVAPFGYQTVYRIFAWFGIEPIFASKILPLILGLLTTGFCFAVCLQLLSVPIAGFIASLLLNQNLWMQDGLVSATPKAFIYPIFLAFLYYLLKRSLLGIIIAIALLGLFYPSLILICAIILGLQILSFDETLPSLSLNKKDYLLCATGLSIALIILLPYVLISSEFGPVITVSEARNLPEFFPGGRASFFNDSDSWNFWFNEARSGIRLPIALIPQLVYAGLLLPILLRYSSRFPLAKKISKGIILLPQLICASLVIFFTAHALLFKLHLPSRYTQHSFRIVMILAASLALTIILDTIFQWANRQFNSQISQLLTLGTTVVFGITLMIYPISWKSFPWTGYIIGKQPALYEFFQAQPKDILIASLSREANNLPTFAQRSILTGKEYAIPYHTGYYYQFRQQTIDLINAQYSDNIDVLVNFIQKYEIDFWLFSASLHPNHITKDPWLMNYQPIANEVVKQLKQGKKPVLKRFIKKCSVWNNKGLVVLDSHCIISRQEAGGRR